jgi:hypothetical protein
MKNNKTGYVLIITMLILAASTAIVSSLIYRASSAVPFGRFAISQTRAECLARSGIAVAQALLSVNPEKKDTKKADDQKNAKKNPTDAELKKLFNQFLPFLNQWSTFVLKESVDGVDGIIELYLACEDGKINLNTAYDFDKKTFINEKKGDAKSTSMKDLIQLSCQKIEKQIKMTGLFEALEKFFKKLDGPLDDITQLLLIPEIQKIKNDIYPYLVENKKDTRMLLSDLFTVYGSNKKLQPWVFSSSINLFVDLKKPVTPTEQEQVKMIQGWLKNYKKNVTDWKKEWGSTFKQMYSKELQSLPKGIDLHFDTSCVPHLFSVISIGKIDEISFSILAIIEIVEHKKDNLLAYKSIIKKWYVL